MESLIMLLSAAVVVEAVVPPQLSRSLSRDDLIKEYFFEGYEYRVIICFLYFVHGVSISLRQLKRALRAMNLHRRVRVNHHVVAIRSLLRDELRSSGSSLGYRAMWKRLQQKYHIVVPRDLVMRMLFQLDPEGCFERKYKKLRRRKYRNQGPNYTWHCDGYDKLKPYGFPIHGCIDGYSRRILWLRFGTTNNNPAVIAHYFLTCVNELGGTPRILRCDLGTENTHVAFLQPFLRRNGTDCFSGEHSFRYGKSVSNQRIEAWWSHLKRCFTGWWIELFQGMQFSGLYDETNCIHRDCLQFCFMHIIQRELDAVVREWNTHRIRPSKDCLVPAGIPDELFFLPQVQGTVSYLCATNRQDLHATQRYEEVPDPPGSLSFLQMVNELMTEHQFHFPHTIEEAMCLYAELVVLIEAENH